MITEINVLATAGRPRAVQLAEAIRIDVQWDVLGMEFYQELSSDEQSSFLMEIADQFDSHNGALQMAYIAQEIPSGHRGQVIRFLEDLAASIRTEEETP